MNSLFSIGNIVETVNGDWNLRSEPCTDNEACKVKETMNEGTPLTIIDGPEREDGYTWWRVKKQKDEVMGWIVEAMNDVPTKVSYDVGRSYGTASTPALGKRVGIGETLGQVYNYGCANSGAHLHFAVSTDGKTGFLPLDDTGIVRVNGEVIFTGKEINDGKIIYEAMPRQ